MTRPDAREFQRPDQSPRLTLGDKRLSETAREVDAVDRDAAREQAGDHVQGLALKLYPPTLQGDGGGDHAGPFERDEEPTRH